MTYSLIHFSLNNLYNSLSPSNPSRYVVFMCVLKISARLTRIELIMPLFSELDEKVKTWGITNDRVRDLFLIVSEMLREQQPT